jgi:two-component system phosphate regulon sensor histidine kinase PhoR
MMDGWVAFVLLILALGFFILWRREVSWRMKYMLQARRRQREAENCLSESEAREVLLRGVLDATGDLLLVTDFDFHVQYANFAAQQFFGLLDGQPSLIGYSANLELENLATEVLELGIGEKIERVILIKDQPHRVRAIIVANGVGLALTNIVELQRLSRARQDMITNLSHELRTPLTSLRLLADTVRGPAGQDPETARDLVNKMVVEVDQLHQMSEELLDLAAIESGKQVMRLVPMALADLVVGPVERMLDQAERRDVVIQVLIDPKARVFADREQAARAILNVLHNAIKYSPEGGEVVITSEHLVEEGHVILSIMDAGPGIPPEELERVFERFYRSNWAWGTPGTGLGLAIARHILQAHGGRIWAENRELPERGAVFHLAFPEA